MRKTILLGMICATASASLPHRNGIFLHTSNGQGVGLGYFSNSLDGSHQIRSMLAYSSSTHRTSALVEGTEQSFDISIGGLAASLSYRHYPIHWIYLNSGIIYSRQKAEYEFRSSISQAEMRVSGEASMLSIPVFLGNELGRSAILSGYVEGGVVVNLTNSKATRETAIRGDIAGLTFSRDLIAWELGLGLSFNWGK